MTRLLVANHDLREYCFHVKRLHASRPNGLACMNASTKLVCTYGYVICMYVCMHACTFPPCSACLCASRHECACARPPCVSTPACYREDAFHACMCAGRYVCVLPPRSACLCAIFPSRVLACAVQNHVYSLWQGCILCIYVCSTLGMYDSVFRMLVPCLPVTRARIIARRS